MNPEPHPIDWNHWSDGWRSRYHSMSFREHQSDTDAILGAHPKQAGFDHEALETCLDCYLSTQGLRVVEFGGWRGGLAHEVLSRHFDISEWVNYEMATISQDDEECIDHRYFLRVPDDFAWNTPSPECDLFVSSHSIEHITQEHLWKLLEWLPSSCRHLWLQAPLPNSCTDNQWENYGGTHILECGWEQIKERLREMGFVLIWRGGIRNECLFFEKPI